MDPLTIYQLMPTLSDEEYNALKADIAERGVLIPIELDEEGNVLDGHHRLRAWQELVETGLELPEYPRVIRGGMSEEQKRNHVRALNILRRHLSKEQLHEQWAAMRADGMTYQAIADASGVSDQTVINSVSKNLETQPEAVTGKDGKKYPAKKRRHKKAKPPAAPQVSVYAQGEIGEEKAKVRAQKVVEAGSEGASQPVATTIFSSETNEYYTPPEYVEAAREVMGDIDLDPASHPKAQEWIKANTFYVIADDGLTKPWFGRVWLNPPYGKEGNESNQEIWSQHLIDEYVAGNVSEAVLLVKAALGYNWFENLWWVWPTCFARERLSFIRSNGSNEGKSKQGTAFLYLGKNTDRFVSVFRQFGRVILPEWG